VQLLGRHWVITDGAGGVTEVAKGSPGVVGCTPILKPGTCFQYYSGTDLDTRTGTMRGSFQMARLCPTHKTPVDAFDAEVAPFPFVGPDPPSDDEGEAGGQGSN
jgi:ApaG protein